MGRAHVTAGDFPALSALGISEFPAESGERGRNRTADTGIFSPYVGAASKYATRYAIVATSRRRSGGRWVANGLTGCASLVGGQP